MIYEKRRAVYAKSIKIKGVGSIGEEQGVFHQWARFNSHVRAFSGAMGSP
jgi:hypothetical protein